MSHEGAEGSAVRAIYTQRRSKSGSSVRLLPAYIGYAQWDEDEATEVRSILPYPDPTRTA